MLAADEEVGRGQLAAGFDLERALLDEAAEGGEAGAGAEHDEGRGGDVSGRVEAVGGLDGDVDEVALFDVGEVVGCYA